MKRFIIAVMAAGLLAAGLGVDTNTAEARPRGRVVIRNGNVRGNFNFRPNRGYNNFRYRGYYGAPGYRYNRGYYGGYYGPRYNYYNYGYGYPYYGGRGVYLRF